jgi:hypothetical protein
LININTSIFLNGIYYIDSDIVVTEKYKKEEFVLHFGNYSRNNNFLMKTENSNNLTIKTKKNEKYLKDEKLIKDSNSFIGCKVYSVYHFSSKSNLNEKNKIKTQQSSHNKKNDSNGDEKIIVFNDIASQNSFTHHSFLRNNISSNNINKANKISKADEKITKKFNIAKLLLLLIVFTVFLFIIIQSVIIIKSHKELEKRNELYIQIGNYQNCIDNLFFSVLSLICLGESKNSYNCSHFMNEMTKLAMFYNFLVEIIEQNSNIDNKKFLNFTELIFTQNKILYQFLDNIINSLSS